MCRPLAAGVAGVLQGVVGFVVIGDVDGSIFGDGDRGVKTNIITFVRDTATRTVGRSCRLGTAGNTIDKNPCHFAISSACTDHQVTIGLVVSTDDDLAFAPTDLRVFAHFTEGKRLTFFTFAFGSGQLAGLGINFVILGIGRIKTIGTLEVGTGFRVFNTKVLFDITTLARTAVSSTTRGLTLTNALYTSRFFITRAGDGFSTGVLALSGNTVFVFQTTLEVAGFAFAISEITADFSTATTLAGAIAGGVGVGDTRAFVITDLAIGTRLLGSALFFDALFVFTKLIVSTGIVFDAAFPTIFVDTNIAIAAIAVFGALADNRITATTTRDQR
jgi:hypothetical protein